MTKPLNVEAPEFTPTRKVSKTPSKQQQDSEVAEYYPASLLREAVLIVNEKLKLEKKVAAPTAVTREDRGELPRQTLRLPCERALIGGELFDQICDVESDGTMEGGAEGNGDFPPLSEVVGGATVRTVSQQRRVREILFVLGVCRMRTVLRQQTSGVQETLDEEQFYAEENYRLSQSTESIMREILQLRFEMGKLLELIREMKTQIRQMEENSTKNNNQRMVMMVPPPTATTAPQYEIAIPRAQGNPPIPTPMVGHLLNRKRLKDKQIIKF